MSTWILLRGLTREHGHWGRFLTLLSQATPDALVSAPDLPGTGQRHCERSPSQVRGISDSVRSELLRDGIPPPYRLLGLSLGGMVAADWAASWPDEVERCVLINTSLRRHSAWHERAHPRQIPALLASLFDPDGARSERRILQATSSDPQAHADVLVPWQRIRRERPVSLGNAMRQLLAAARFDGPGSRPEVPTLVIASQRDRLVDPACSQALARQWRAPLLMHPSAGHDLPLDDPAWLVAQLAGWQPHRRVVTRL